MIEDIHILKSHPLQTLVKARQKIFPASPVPVRPGPHVISGFCTDDQLVTVLTQVFLQYSSEIFLRASRPRPVIICKVEMGDPIVKRRKADLSHRLKRSSVSEIMP